MLLLRISLLLLLFPVFANAQAGFRDWIKEQRTWTNTRGQEVQGKLISLKSDQVELEKFSTGETISLPRHKLSETDQAYLATYEEIAKTFKVNPARGGILQRIIVPRAIVLIVVLLLINVVTLCIASLPFGGGPVSRAILCALIVGILGVLFRFILELIAGGASDDASAAVAGGFALVLLIPFIFVIGLVYSVSYDISWIKGFALSILHNLLNSLVLGAIYFGVYSSPLGKTLAQGFELMIQLISLG